jgi:hypothetical protein
VCNFRPPQMCNFRPALTVLVERAYALSGRLHQTPKFSLIHG